MGNKESILEQTSLIWKKLKDKPQVENHVVNFFKKDVRQYISHLTELDRIIKEKSFPNEEWVQVRLKRYTDDILQKGNNLLQEKIKDKALERKIREKFRQIVSRWVFKSNIISWACKRPRGYPGDYKVLEFMYDNQPCSEDLGYYFDKLFIGNPYVEAVRTRKDKMNEILKKFIETSHLPIINILNIGCGSCRDLKELLYSLSEYHLKKLHFICVDQDAEALNYSKNSLQEISSKICIKFLRENFVNFSKEPNKYINLLRDQEIIYLSGVADYLLDNTLTNLTQFCYNLLPFHGKLIIAHKDTEIDKDSLLYPEWLGNEWRFVSRDEAYLVNLIKCTVPGNYSLTIERDITKYIFFAIFTKG